MDTVRSVSRAEIDLSYHLNDSESNLEVDIMNKNSNEVKTVTTSSMINNLESCVNNGQCLDVSNLPVEANLKLTGDEGYVRDSRQGFSSSPAKMFEYDQVQVRNNSNNPNYTCDQVSSTYSGKIVPVEQGINPILCEYQKALCNIDSSRITPVKVDFTNICLYCPVQNTLNTVVYLHNIKPNKGGAFFYYVQYLNDVNMCYFTNCQKIPDGELIVLYSMELLFSVSILYNLCTDDRKVSRTANTDPIEVYNEFIKDLNIWNRYKLSYDDYITNIIDVLIIEQ